MSTWFDIQRLVFSGIQGCFPLYEKEGKKIKGEGKREKDELEKYGQPSLMCCTYTLRCNALYW